MTSHTPNNLPQQLTSFIGRQREMSEVKKLISISRLVTLTGAGGMGKTRLALQVAQTLLDKYPDGVWFVDLSTRSDPEWVAQAVAATLGLNEEASQPLTVSLGTYLRARKALLILDNCEHIVDACASLVDELLRVSTDLHIIATSREVLDVDGEVTWNVPSLSMPDPSNIKSVEHLEQYESVQLFIARARYKRPNFALTPDNCYAVARLCHELDGMPLAIELAAACIKVLSIEQIVERLNDRFRLMARGSRLASPRQQTLYALMDWSYDLLSPQEQELLRYLSVFAGGFTLEACQAICEGAEEHETIHLLLSLVDKSLVIMEEQEGHTRYRLLETIRQYAWEKLLGTGTAEVVRNRHLAWCLAMVEQAAPRLANSDQAEWLDRLELEHGNIRAAMSWSLISEERAESALRMAWALKMFWILRGYLSEGRERTAEALGHSPESSALYWRARAHGALSMIAWFLGDDQASLEHAEQSLQIGRELGDSEIISFALIGIGSVARRLGDLATARAALEETIPLLDGLGRTYDLALAVLNLGRVALAQGDYDEAALSFQRSLEMYEAFGDAFSIATVIYEMGNLALIKGQHEQAAQLLVESLGMFREVGVKLSIARTLRTLAGLASSRSEWVRAVRLYAAAQRLFDELGYSVPSAEASEYERTLDALRVQLDWASWEDAWHKGAAMSVDDIVEYGMQASPRKRRRSRGARVSARAGDKGATPAHLSLSARETQVLRLVAAGHSDPQVASHLSISPRTVEAHLRSIYSKLEVTNRREATRYAREHNLL